MISVGELSLRKNHKVVINALAELRNKEFVNYIKYMIAGSGELWDELNALIEEKGLKETVQLLGYRNDINDLCKVADLFVLPSLQEGLPVALMEAMASGLPCIASKIRGNTDLLDEGLFDPHNMLECGSVLMKKDLQGTINSIIYNRKKIKAFCKEEVENKMVAIYEGI